VSFGFGVLRNSHQLPRLKKIPLETMQQWIAEDERGSESFWQKAGKA